MRRSRTLLVSSTPPALQKNCRLTRAFSFLPVINSTTELLGSLSSSYFDMIRDTVYSEAEEEQSRLIILAVLQSVSFERTSSRFEKKLTSPFSFRQTLDTVTQSLAPIAPYLAEELYSHRIDIEKTSPSAFGREWISPVSLSVLEVFSSSLRRSLRCSLPSSTQAGTIPKLEKRCTRFSLSSPASSLFFRLVERKSKPNSRLPSGPSGISTRLD